MGEEGRRIVEKKYSVDVMAKRLYEFYSSLLVVAVKQ